MVHRANRLTAYRCGRKWRAQALPPVVFRAPAEDACAEIVSRLVTKDATRGRPGGRLAAAEAGTLHKSHSLETAELQSRAASKCSQSATDLEIYVQFPPIFDMVPEMSFNDFFLE